MRLILLDPASDKRINFYPIALSRPIWELRVGMTSLADKMVAKVNPSQVACFLPPYMAEVYRSETDWAVNDPSTLVGDDLLLVNARVKAANFDVAATGPSQGGGGGGGPPSMRTASVSLHELPRMIWPS